MKHYRVDYRLEDGTKTFMMIRCKEQVKQENFYQVDVDGTVLIDIPGYIDTVEDWS